MKWLGLNETIRWSVSVSTQWEIPTRVLQCNVQQEKMIQLHCVYREQTAFPQEFGCAGACVLVMDSVLDIKRQQVLQFKRRLHVNSQFWIGPMGSVYERQVLVRSDSGHEPHSIVFSVAVRPNIQTERCTAIIRSAARDCPIWTCKEILPSQALRGPSETKAGCRVVRSALYYENNSHHQVSV